MWAKVSTAVLIEAGFRTSLTFLKSFFIIAMDSSEE